VWVRTLAGTLAPEPEKKKKNVQMERSSRGATKQWKLWPPIQPCGERGEKETQKGGEGGFGRGKRNLKGCGRRDHGFKKGPIP